MTAASTTEEVARGIATKLSALRAQLAEVEPEVARLAAEYERTGSDKSLRSLSSGERRREKLGTEIARLEAAESGIQAQLAAEREAAEAKRLHAAALAYVAARDKVQAGNVAISERLTQLGSLAAKVREADTEVRRAASELGIGADSTWRRGVQGGYHKNLMDNALQGIGARDPERLGSHAIAALSAIRTPWRKAGSPVDVLLKAHGA